MFLFNRQTNFGRVYTKVKPTTLSSTKSVQLLHETEPFFTVKLSRVFGFRDPRVYVTWPLRLRLQRETFEVFVSTGRVIIGGRNVEQTVKQMCLYTNLYHPGVPSVTTVLNLDGTSTRHPSIFLRIHTNTPKIKSSAPLTTKVSDLIPATNHGRIK